MESIENQRILIVDDDVTALTLYETILRSAGYSNIIICNDGVEAEFRLRDNDVSLVLLDINLPGLSGVEILERVIGTSANLPVVMITADEDLQTVITCMKRGAYDYITKPPAKARLVTAVKKALEWRELNGELWAMGKRVLDRAALETPEAFSKLITNSDSMLAIFQYVEAVAKTNRPVLIMGESGTGKELLAQAIHESSGRQGAMITVNAAGLVDKNIGGPRQAPKTNRRGNPGSLSGISQQYSSANKQGRCQPQEGHSYEAVEQAANSCIPKKESPRQRQYPQQQKSNAKFTAHKLESPDYLTFDNPVFFQSGERSKE